MHCAPWVEPLERRQMLAGSISEQIIIDQFGWRNDAPRKVVIFADPVNGQNSSITYTPGATFEIRRTSDDAIVLSGPTVQWRAGAIHADSGDRVWYGDFSSLVAPGEYYVYDPANDLRSYPFRLDGALYNQVLKTSIRTFYYQRSGTAILPQFGGNWTHGIDHVGPGQDTQARLWLNGAAQGQARDVSGGWFDAGDYNKYVPFTTSVLWNLLTAFEFNPGVFGDNWNIPQSGNGVPDVLDEIKYELDWLLKMQNPDGSVLNRVANATYAAGNHDPATDTQPRYYTQATTWATASFAASLAHAARVFAAYELRYPGYSTTLLNAATLAWNYLQLTPSMTPASGSDGGGSGGSGGGLAAAAADANPTADFRLRVLAAAELYKTTAAANYKSYFESNYKSAAGSDNGHHPLLGAWPHFDTTLATELNRAYVTYATTPGASPSIISEIKTSLRNMADGILLTGYINLDDPYRGFMWSGHYTWGSNQLKSEWANLLLYAIRLNVNPANTPTYREIAEEYLHYLHGRNPLSQLYLSNMGSKGANLGGDKSVMQVYHSWFGDGSALYDGPGSTYGPIPGYLVGGPNQYFSVATISPPAGQPPMKAFRDWNTGWPENSWEITEPAIYYQAAYSLLLSHFATDTYPPLVLSSSFNPLRAPHAVTIAFNEDVRASLSADDLVLVNLTSGQTIASTQMLLSYDEITNTATFAYAGGILPDGNYRATIPSASVRDAAGNSLTGELSFDFFVLGGDANRDRAVNQLDLDILVMNWQQSGRSFAQGDFNYDDRVDSRDLLILASRWQTALPAPLAAWPGRGERTAAAVQRAIDLLS